MMCNTNGRNGCKAFAPGAIAACTGIDITVPVTCENANNTVEVSVCNRGTVSAPAGVNCYVYPGGSPQYPNASPGLGTLVMTTRTTIAPGACESQAIPDTLFPAGGTESLMCNPPTSGTTYRQIPECNYNNNWSVAKQNPPLACQNVTGGYAPLTYRQTYASSCPPGTRTQWAFLSYNATTPSNASGSSDVKFQIQTAPVLADGGIGAATAWVTVADTPRAGDPAVCPMSGPLPCPKDLYALLGGPPAANNQNLTLQVTMTPSPDNRVAPTLNSWQITYSCPPAE
jgi:hypothetical protein